MSPDDERRPAVGIERSASSDDLSSLSDSLGPAAEPSARELDDDAGDLRALATVGRVGGSKPAAPPAVEASVPAPPPRARAAWVLPLAVGLALGLGSAAALFSLSSRRFGEGATSEWAPTQRSALQQEPEPAPAPAPPASAPPPPPAPQAAAEAVPTPPPAPAAVEVAELAPEAPNERAQRPRLAAPKDAKPSLARPAAPSQSVAAASPRAVAAIEPSVPSSAPPAPPARSMEDLLDEALTPGGPTTRAPLPASEATRLPLTPSREDVTKAVTMLLPAVRGCAQGEAGLATATLVVRNDGHVASVDVQGAPFAGAPSGRCIEGVLRRARLPAFQQASFRVKFPLAIQ